MGPQPRAALLQSEGQQAYALLHSLIPSVRQLALMHRMGFSAQGVDWVALGLSETPQENDDMRNFVSNIVAMIEQLDAQLTTEFYAVTGQ